MSEIRGTIVAIGGAEDRKADRVILRRFVRLCGGLDARIAILPTASRRRSTGREYARIFQDLHVRSAEVLKVRSRSDCRREEILTGLEKATGLFMTGGAQLNLTGALEDTPLAEAIHRRNRDGLHVAGTSAGAAFLSTHMIGSGDDGQVARAGMVNLAAGLGLLPGIIIDQHFRQRNRLGRLITALSLHPDLLGIGVDEDTAAFLDGEGGLTVSGSGGITIVDPAAARYADVDRARKGDPVSVAGLQVHVLIDGDTYNPVTRKANPGVAINAGG